MLSNTHKLIRPYVLTRRKIISLGTFSITKQFVDISSFTSLLVPIPLRTSFAGKNNTDFVIISSNDVNPLFRL